MVSTRHFRFRKLYQRTTNPIFGTRRRPNMCIGQAPGAGVRCSSLRSGARAPGNVCSVIKKWYTHYARGAMNSACLANRNRQAFFYLSEARAGTFIQFLELVLGLAIPKQSAQTHYTPLPSPAKQSNRPWARVKGFASQRPNARQKKRGGWALTLDTCLSRGG